MISREAIAIIQVRRDHDLDQCSSGKDEKWLDSTYILMIETMGLSDVLDVRYKRKRGVTAESKVWSLNKDGEATY